jgi:hypothetical protein
MGGGRCRRPYSRRQEMAVNKKAVPAPAEVRKDEPANIKPATEFEASGAVIEPSVVDGVDMAHPAVDDNPRKDTTKDMNKIDFNDPTKTPEEAVEENLKNG